MISDYYQFITFLHQFRGQQELDRIDREREMEMEREM